ncbi:hypothetical protein DT23_11280 [Thioclava indica]|uniref:Uncharacterized protein n=1 Tax=Thioclava indica TaxID=1353528 RepID=A0A074JWV8_9RHOB|nr:hypothetical protein DT23_11280 [Thioclava indica]
MSTLLAARKELVAQVLDRILSFRKAMNHRVAIGTKRNEIFTRV